MDENSKIAVVVAHARRETREQLVDVVSGLGHDVCGVYNTTARILSACKMRPPDLIFSGVQMPDGDAIDALVKISESSPTPAIIVTPEDSMLKVAEALRDHVMAYLVEPIDPQQIKPTIYLVCERFRQFQLLKSENEDLKQALADRKVIERAKGILMGMFELSEAEFFRRLQKLAQSRRMKLAAVADAVIEGAEPVKG